MCSSEKEAIEITVVPYTDEASDNDRFSDAVILFRYCFLGSWKPHNRHG